MSKLTQSLEMGLEHLRNVIETGATSSYLCHKHKNGLKYCLKVNSVKLSETRILVFAKDDTDRILAG